MDVRNFVDIIGTDFYTGVPDSQLKSLCNYLINTYGIGKNHHIIGANEGNWTGEVNASEYPNSALVKTVDSFGTKARSWMKHVRTRNPRGTRQLPRTGLLSLGS